MIHLILKIVITGVVSLGKICGGEVIDKIFTKDCTWSSVGYSNRLDVSDMHRCAVLCASLPLCYRFSYHSTQQCLYSQYEASSGGSLSYTRTALAVSYRVVDIAEDNMLAQGKPASSSPVRSESRFSSSNTVDGIYDPLEEGLGRTDSLMVIEDQSDPWLIIDLLDDYCIKAVKVWGRGVTSSGSDHTRNIDVKVAPASSQTDYQSCVYRDGILEAVEQLDCQGPVSGRFVKVQSMISTGFFEIHEIEVIGH